MKHKDYEKPTMEVVMVQQAHLLAESVEAKRYGYGAANSDVDEEEEIDEKGIWQWY